MSLILGMDSSRSDFGDGQLLDDTSNRGIYQVDQRLGPDAEDQHTGGESAQHEDLATVDVRQFRNVLVRDVAPEHALHHPQRVGGTDDQGERGEQGDPGVGAERGQDDHELADETAGARQTAVGHGEQHVERDEDRHHVDDATVILDLARMHAVVQHADAAEHRAGDEAVRDHLHHRTLHAQAGGFRVVRLANQQEGDEDAQGHETHVRDGRVGHQLLHVLLDQRDITDVADRDQAEDDDQPREVVGSIRRDRQAETQETVATDLQHHRRQHHRTTGGRFDVGIRQPGVYRHHRHLDREAQQEGEEQPALLGQRQVDVGHVGDGETAAGLVIQVDQADQHEDRAEERVDEKLQRGVDAARATPDTDDDEHRDQHGLEEHVEQHRVRGAEHADHRAFENKHGRHVLVRLVLDDLPRAHDHEDLDEGREDDQGDGDTVDRQRVVDAQRRNPGERLAKLESARGGVIGRQEGKAGGEGGNRDQQRDPAGEAWATGAGQQHRDGADDREPDQQAEQVIRHIARFPYCPISQYPPRSRIRPRIMANT